MARELFGPSEGDCLALLVLLADQPVETVESVSVDSRTRVGDGLEVIVLFVAESGGLAAGAEMLEQPAEFVESLRLVERQC